MRIVLRHSASWLLLLVAAVVLPAVQTPAVHAGEPPRASSYLWLDVNRQPLPFQDHATIREVMRAARVVSRERIERGVAGVEKLVLEHDNTRLHAAFRSVDITIRKPPSGGVEKSTMRYRDAAIFESAAYELSQLLGMGRVPPVVERRLGTQDGTLQIWIEDTLAEVERTRRKLQPPDVVRWYQQKQIMYLFDSLIANVDRNQGNMLIDRSWTLWLIDHTRAFQRSSKLLYGSDLRACERNLWRSLREVDEETLRQRLEPYLTHQEISTLLRRRLKLIDHIQKLIDKRGEGAVLFDLRPPAAEKADWSH